MKDCPIVAEIDCKYDSKPGGCNKERCSFRHKRIPKRNDHESINMNKQANPASNKHSKRKPRPVPHANDARARFMNLQSMSSALDDIEHKRNSSDQARTAPPLPLYCAVCKKSSRLNWPILDLSSMNDADFSYSTELQKYVKRHQYGNDKSYTRLDGAKMTHKDSKSECTHKVGYGEIWCQFCGVNVTQQFNPTHRKCPNAECQAALHGAISTHGAIKIH